MTQRTHTMRGFGLLEVVIASGILAIVVGAAVGLVRSSLRRTVIGLERTVAMNLAQESIEQLRSARDSIHTDGIVNEWTSGWGDVSCEAASNCAPFRVSFVAGRWQVSQTGAEEIEVDGQTYRREVYISVPTGYAANVGLGQSADVDLARKVHVIVRWDGNAQAVESATFLTNWRSGL